MGQEPVDSAIVTQYCTDLLTEAREKGFIGKLRTQIKQANWEEARNILQEIKVLSLDKYLLDVSKFSILTPNIKPPPNLLPSYDNLKNYPTILV